MANMSNYLENKLIDFIFRGKSYTAPATIYIALCTATPTDSSTGSTITEVSGGNYARQSLAADTTNWAATNGAASTTDPSSGTSGTTSNNSDIVWSGVTWSATVTSIAICDASTNGNMLFWGSLNANQTVTSGNTVTISTSALTIQIDN